MLEQKLRNYKGRNAYMREYQRKNGAKIRAKYPERFKAQQSRWYKKHREKALASARADYKENHDRRLAKRYNLSTAEMALLRHSSCELCGKTYSLTLDHDHKTGKFRGVLCQRCNGGLGMLGDNVEGLQKAINYLQNGNKYKAVVSESV